MERTGIGNDVDLEDVILGPEPNELKDSSNTVLNRKKQFLLLFIKIHT